MASDRSSYETQNYRATHAHPARSAEFLPCSSTRPSLGFARTSSRFHREARRPRNAWPDGRERWERLIQYNNPLYGPPALSPVHHKDKVYALAAGAVSIPSIFLTTSSTPRCLLSTPRPARDSSIVYAGSRRFFRRRLLFSSGRSLRSRERRKVGTEGTGRTCGPCF